MQHDVYSVVTQPSFSLFVHGHAHHLDMTCTVDWEYKNTICLSLQFYPSLISLIVSVDVKHHVYLIEIQGSRRDQEEGGGAGHSSQPRRDHEQGGGAGL